MDIIEANQNPRDKKNSVEEISFKESKAKNANNNIYIFEEKNDINNNIRNPVIIRRLLILKLNMQMRLIN